MISFHLSSLTKLAGIGSLVLLTGCAVAPKPLQQSEIDSLIEQDRKAMFKDQPPVAGELDLYQVMARAMLYNLEHRTQRLAEAVAQGQFELAKYDMLPTLTGEVGRVSRSNVNASRSVSIFSGNETLEPSTSQDQNRTIANLRFSWNVLDFGVSYFQAKQEADRYLISEGSRRKVLQNLLQQSRTAYWRALAAQELEQPSRDNLELAQRYLADLDRGLKAGAFPQPLKALQLKRQLLETIRELESLQESLKQARIELANLINLPSSRELPQLTPMQLAPLPSLEALDINALELTALRNSTDLAEQIYNTRIEQLETRKAILRLLPGIEFGYAQNYDSNSFLNNNDWGEASVRVTWNLLRLASTQQTLETTELREGLAAQRRLAVSMAVITQLNLALRQVEATQKQLDRTAELKQIDDQIAGHTANSAASNAASQVERIQTQVSALKTRMAHLQSYSLAQEAYGSFLGALGLNPAPVGYSQMELEQLSEAIQQNLDRWQRGEIPVAEAMAVVEEGTPAEASPESSS